MKKLLLFSILAMAALSACQEDITLDLPQYDNKLAVYCILNPDSLPKLYLNLSKSYFDYGDTSNSLHFVQDARVVITDLTEHRIDTLKLDSGTYNNPYSGYTPKVVFYMGKNKPVTGHRYRLDITWSGKQLNAETEVPFPISISKLEKKATPDDYGDTVYTITARFMDQAGKDNAYQLYTSQWVPEFDSTSGNVNFKEVYQPEEQFVYDNNGADGKELSMQTYVSTYYGMDTLSVSLQISNISVDAAKYLEELYAQDNTKGDPFSEPTILHGNIQGGLGIFGAEARSGKARIKIK